MDSLENRIGSKKAALEKYEEAAKKAKAELKQLQKDQQRKAAEAKRKADAKAKIELGGMIMKLVPGCKTVDDLIDRMYVQGLRLQDGTSVSVVALRDADVAVLQVEIDKRQ